VRQTPYSSTTGQNLLALARIRAAQGRTEEAAKTYASAARHLSVTLGEQHPDTLEAKRAGSKELKKES